MRSKTKSTFGKSQVNDAEILTNNFKMNIEKMKDYFCQTEDLKIHFFKQDSQQSALLYIDTMVKKEYIQSFIIDPLLSNRIEELKNILNENEVKHTSKISSLANFLMDGYCLILKEYESVGMIVSAADDQGRSIQEPTVEQNINGSRDGFVENINTNIHLLRKKIKNPNFIVNYFTLGKVTNTKIALIYLDSIANRKIVEEIQTRISSIDVDNVQSSGSIEELIEDNSYTPFPQILNTERPDRATSFLLEGKVALIIDGTPAVSIVPITFFSFYQAPDDYNHRWLIGSFFRIIRLFSFIIAISLPAIYIAIVSFHSEILPIGILYSIRVSLEFVPFLPLIEAIAMQIILELLKEAAIRLPAPIAQTIGIVGGLVIGTAVVEAHLVSNTMIVVIGFTAIASFVAPISEMGTSARLLGFPTMIAASILGFFGITLTLMVIFMHMCKLQSFGIPYFSPFAPFRKEDLKDTFFRLPVWKLNTRPTNSKPNKLRQQGLSRVWKKK